MRHTGKDEVSPLTVGEGSQMNIPWARVKSTKAFCDSPSFDCRNRGPWRCNCASRKSPNAVSKSQAFGTGSRLMAAGRVLEPLGSNALRHILRLVAAAGAEKAGQPTPIPVLRRREPSLGAALLDGHRHRHLPLKLVSNLNYAYDACSACRSNLRPKAVQKVTPRANRYKQARFSLPGAQKE